MAEGVLLASPPRIGQVSPRFRKRGSALPGARLIWRESEAVRHALVIKQTLRIDVQRQRVWVLPTIWRVYQDSAFEIALRLQIRQSITLKLAVRPRISGVYQQRLPIQALIQAAFSQRLARCRWRIGATRVQRAPLHLQIGTRITLVLSARFSIAGRLVVQQPLTLQISGGALLRLPIDLTIYQTVRRESHFISTTRSST